MLQRISENIQGWIAGVIMALVASTFMLWGVQYYLQDQKGDSVVVAKVGRDKITEKQLKESAQSLMQSYHITSTASLKDQVKTQIKQMALQQLISDRVLTRASIANGFQVGVAQVQQLIQTIPSFQVNGVFSQDKLQQYLYSTGQSYSTFQSQMQRRLANEQVPEGFSASEFVLPSEWKSAYQLYQQTRSFGYFELSNAEYQKSVTVSDAAIKSYYK